MSAAIVGLVIWAVLAIVGTGLIYFIFAGIGMLITGATEKMWPAVLLTVLGYIAAVVFFIVSVIHVIFQIIYVVQIANGH